MCIDININQEDLDIAEGKVKVFNMNPWCPKCNEASKAPLHIFEQGAKAYNIVSRKEITYMHIHEA